MSEVSHEVLNKQIHRLSLLRIPIVGLIIFNLFVLCGIPSATHSDGVLVAAPDIAPAKKKRGKLAPQPPVKPVDLADLRSVELPELHVPNVTTAVQISTYVGQRFANAVSKITPRDYRFGESPVIGLARYATRVARRSLDRTESAAIPTVLGQVQITNPVENGGRVHFRLNDTIISLEPGAKHTIEAGDWNVEFHRGGEFGISEHQIARGHFEFRVDEAQGWQLIEANENSKQ